MRKLSLVVLFILAMAGRSPSPGLAVPGPVQQGDVNCDAVVNAVDSLQILRDVAGLGTTAACLADAGDVNCDAAVNSVDALRLLRYVAGLSNATPAGCTSIGDPLGPAATSEELIDAALAANAIGDEEALLYRVYASFGDARLPPQYKGDDSQEQDSSVMPEVVARFAGLPIEKQALLQPFLLPPNAPGSWFQLSSLSAPSIANAADTAVMFLPVETSPHVKVWYREQHPEDQATAQAIANDIDSTIWTKLTGLFGEPMSDAGRDNNGGDGRVDIFLLDDGLRSSASPYTCQHSPGLINLRRNASRPVLAHELTHVILFSYRVKTECQWPEYQWLHEATAQWAIDFVYPGDQEERAGRECFLSSPGMPLETTNDCREYDAYIWNFFLRWEFGPGLIRDTWINAFQNDSLAAINAALSSRGGFQKVWPKFALDNYNLPPLMLYHDMDGVPFGAKFDDVDVDLGGAASKTYSMRGDVEHMAALYHRYSFNDPSIKSVIFTQPFADGSQPTAKVQAVIEIEGQQPKIEDWTPSERKQFCFDKPEEKINQLLIVISNSEYQNRGSVLMSNPQPELRVSSLGCTGWEGTATVTTEDTVPGGHSLVTINVHVRFEADLPPGMTMCADPGMPPIACEVYSVAAGEFTYSSVVQAGDCTWTIGPGTVSLPHAPPEQGSDGKLVVYTAADPQTYWGGGQVGFMDTLTVDCGETATYPSEAGGIWFQAAPGMFTVKNQGQLIEDTYTEGNTTWEWHFEPVAPE